MFQAETDCNILFHGKAIARPGSLLRSVRRISEVA
jgi:hypothetical protein